jgi:hypothetical protein
MDEAPAGSSSGTPTQGTGDADLARADAAAVVAANGIIDQLLDSFVENLGYTRLRRSGSGNFSQDPREPTQVVIDTIRSAPRGTFDGLNGLYQYAQDGRTGQREDASSFMTIVNFKDSKSQPGQGDKDALMYSNLMAAAMDMGDLADKWGTKVPAWAVGAAARALKDAAYEAHAALILSEPGPEPGSPADLRISDEG